MQLFESKPQELKQPIWTRLFNAAQFAAMNKHEQLEYTKEMNTERDRRNQISYAHECGKAEGEAKEKLNIARNMKAKGADVAFIAECTGLSVEEVDKL